jgi:hypothetical protein
VVSQATPLSGKDLAGSGLSGLFCSCLVGILLKKQQTEQKEKVIIMTGSYSRPVKTILAAFMSCLLAFSESWNLRAQAPSFRATEASLPVSAVIDWKPVEDQSNPYVKAIDGRVIERFTHVNRDRWGYPAARTNYFFLVHPLKKARHAPLCVVLHSLNRTAFDYLGYYFLNRKVDPADEPADHAETIPADAYTLFLDSEGNEEWWGWTTARADIQKYSQHPTPTENRVLDCIEWVARNYAIDRNRIYLTGVSMGGCGSLGIGLVHGDVFAAIRVWVPGGTSYAACRMGFLPPDGSGAKAAFNASLPDPPVVVDLSASNDGWSDDEGVLQTMAADDRFPLIMGWGPFGHTGAYSPVAKYPYCAAVLSLPWMEIRKNEAYPVFTAASTDQQPPWDKSPKDTAATGQINGFFRWRSVIDRPNRFVMRLWLQAPATDKLATIIPQQSTADLTLRRLQHFKVDRDRVYEWNFTRGKEVLASGKIRPDDAGCLTIRHVTITGDPLELQLHPK